MSLRKRTSRSSSAASIELYAVDYNLAEFRVCLSVSLKKSRRIFFRGKQHHLDDLAGRSGWQARQGLM